MNTEKNWASILNWFELRPKITGLLLFIVLSIAIIVISLLENQILRKEEHEEMDVVLSEVHQKIEQSLKNCYSTTVSLALTLNNEGVPQNFDSISKQIINSNPIVSVVQLVPNGIIKYIYPMKGNEAAMNLNILGAKDLKKEAEKSIETQKIYFAGPLKLRQGGVGIVGRLPIYLNNKFWGFSAVIIKLETLFNYSGINSANHSKYYFQFSKKNSTTSKEQFFLPTKTDFTNHYYISKSINDSDWKIYLVAKKPFIVDSSILFRAILGFIIAILFGVLTTKFLKTPEKLRQLLKDQELRLLKNELKFKTIFDQATIGFAIINAKTRDITEVNDKFCTLLGYSFDEIKEKRMTKISHPDDAEITLLNLKKLDEGKISNFSQEKRYITKSGEILHVNLTVFPILRENDKPSSYIVFINDITKRVEAEDLIKKSQARYKSLIDTIDGIVWEYDLETKSSTFVSKKIETILGYTEQEYFESPTFWEDHIHPDDLKTTLSLSAKENKNYINHDLVYRMISKKGEIVWIRDIMNFVFENDKPVISRGIMIDITKMKDSEKELNKTLELVTEQNKRLLNFSYIVSHNLRSHTSNIESIISLIDLSETEEERKEMMQLLKTVSISLDETMKHLNEVVNINTNLSLITKPLNLNFYIDKAKEVLQEQIALTETTFVTNVPADAMINYNSAYLESILYNLISNAIRYKHDQRKPIITINFYKEKYKDVLEISDNGIGIDLVKNGDKIFGMYKTFNNNSDARGIGLFITKNQIDAMGGTLTLDSTLDEGSIFKIYT
jgi:diguanylate cyclase